MDNELKKQLLDFFQELQGIQAKAFYEWDIKSEAIPDVCELMQDTSYFLDALKKVCK